MLNQQPEGQGEIIKGNEAQELAAKFQTMLTETHSASEQLAKISDHMTFKEKGTLEGILKGDITRLANRLSGALKTIEETGELSAEEVESITKGFDNMTRYVDNKLENYGQEREQRPEKMEVSDDNMEARLAELDAELKDEGELPDERAADAILSEEGREDLKKIAEIREEYGSDEDLMPSRDDVMGMRIVASEKEEPASVEAATVEEEIQLGGKSERIVETGKSAKTEKFTDTEISQLESASMELGASSEQVKQKLESKAKEAKEIAEQIMSNAAKVGGKYSAETDAQAMALLNKVEAAVKSGERYNPDTDENPLEKTAGVIASLNLALKNTDKVAKAHEIATTETRFKESIGKLGLKAVDYGNDGVEFQSESGETVKASIDTVIRLAKRSAQKVAEEFKKFIPKDNSLYAKLEIESKE